MCSFQLTACLISTPMLKLDKSVSACSATLVFSLTNSPHLRRRSPADILHFCCCPYIVSKFDFVVAILSLHRIKVCRRCRYIVSTTYQSFSSVSLHCNDLLLSSNQRDDCYLLVLSHYSDDFYCTLFGVTLSLPVLLLLLHLYFISLLLSLH